MNSKSQIKGVEKLTPPHKISDNTDLNKLIKGSERERAEKRIKSLFASKPTTDYNQPFLEEAFSEYMDAKDIVDTMTSTIIDIFEDEFPDADTTFYSEGKVTLNFRSTIPKYSFQKLSKILPKDCGWSVDRSYEDDSLVIRIFLRDEYDE